MPKQRRERESITERVAVARVRERGESRRERKRQKLARREASGRENWEFRKFDLQAGSAETLKTGSF